MDKGGLKGTMLFSESEELELESDDMSFLKDPFKAKMSGTSTTRKICFRNWYPDRDGR
jgi:hypothetical protein